MIYENERIDDLEFKNLKIIQSDSCFCFGIDAVLLSDFAKEIKKGSIVADLCSGNGIVSILLSAKTSASKFYAVEIQEKISDMAMRSVKLNKLEEKINVLNMDLKHLPNKFNPNFFDAIVCNPPYKKANSGLKNTCKEKLIARHEIMCNLEDIVSVSSKLLKNNGNIYMVHRPERLVDIMELFRKYNLEPKVLRFVQPYANKAPNLVLVKAVKNGNSFLKVLKPLIVYNQDGTYTEDILKIYNKK
jgi:tRNA1Val (adenine37-N6)-methyltransferase